MKNNEVNVELKNQNELSKHDEIRLKCYLKDIPDFSIKIKIIKKYFLEWIIKFFNKIIYYSQIIN